MFAVLASGKGRRIIILDGQEALSLPRSIWQDEDMSFVEDVVDGNGLDMRQNGGKLLKQTLWSNAARLCNQHCKTSTFKATTITFGPVGAFIMNQPSSTVREYMQLGQKWCLIANTYCRPPMELTTYIHSSRCFRMWQQSCCRSICCMALLLPP